MINISSSNVLKSLEQERNIYHSLASNTLHNEVVASFVNVFLAVAVSSVYERRAQNPPLEAKELYKKFLTVKFYPFRFLQEIFLTTAEIFNTTEEKRDQFIFSLAVSEKIIEYELDSLLLETDPGNCKLQEKLKANQVNYAEFIADFGKVSDLVPDNISDYFPIPKKEDEFIQNYGFKYNRQAKLQYGNVILQNRKVKITFEKLVEIGVLDKKITHPFFKNLYDFHSRDSHSTITSVLSFEKFIASTKKELLIDAQARQNDTYIKLVSLLMDVLCKMERGQDLEGLKSTYQMN